MTDRISVFCNLKLARSEQTIPLDGEAVRALCAASKCVGCNPFCSLKTLDARLSVKANPGRVTAGSALLPLADNRFVLFADGTLFYRFDAPVAAIERFIKLAAEKGCLIKKVYGTRSIRTGYAYADMQNLTERVNDRYVAENDYVFVPLPPLKKFVKELFAGGNVCLTASQKENLPADCREYLALFADGRFLVAEEYARRGGVRDYRKVDDFCRRYPQYVYLQKEPVPQSYIKAVYRHAAAYEWFLPAGWTAAAGAPVWDDESKLQMNIFLYKLFADGNKCLSVVNPFSKSYFSPDRANYALFADGRLLLDEKKSDLLEQDLLAEIRGRFPALEPKPERVPSFYIAEIYRRLPKMQKSAREIYLEMLKQKARKLKRTLKLCHHEALELAARITGWKDWREAAAIDEAHARLAIDTEKSNKRTAALFGCDQTEKEYEEYLRRKKR